MPKLYAVAAHSVCTVVADGLLLTPPGHEMCNHHDDTEGRSITVSCIVNSNLKLCTKAFWIVYLYQFQLKKITDKTYISFKSTFVKIGYLQSQVTFRQTTLAFICKKVNLNSLSTSPQLTARFTCISMSQWLIWCQVHLSSPAQIMGRYPITINSLLEAMSASLWSRYIVYWQHVWNYTTACNKKWGRLNKMNVIFQTSSNIFC